MNNRKPWTWLTCIIAGGVWVSGCAVAMCQTAYLAGEPAIGWDSLVTTPPPARPLTSYPAGHLWADFCVEPTRGCHPCGRNDCTVDGTCCQAADGGACPGGRSTPLGAASGVTRAANRSRPVAATNVQPPAPIQNKRAQAAPGRLPFSAARGTREVSASTPPPLPTTGGRTQGYSVVPAGDRQWPSPPAVMPRTNEPWKILSATSTNPNRSTADRIRQAQAASPATAVPTVLVTPVSTAVWILQDVDGPSQETAANDAKDPAESAGIHQLKSQLSRISDGEE
jgi:hypothetical protein